MNKEYCLGKNIMIPLAPFVQERPRVIHQRRRTWTYVPSSAKEKQLRFFLKDIFPKPIPRHVKLSLTLMVWRKENRGDLSNYLKAFEDSANKILWEDDSQIYEIKAKKLLDREAPVWQFIISLYKE